MSRRSSHRKTLRRRADYLRSQAIPSARHPQRMSRLLAELNALTGVLDSKGLTRATLAPLAQRVEWLRSHPAHTEREQSFVSQELAALRWALESNGITLSPSPVDRPLQR